MREGEKGSTNLLVFSKKERKEQTSIVYIYVHISKEIRSRVFLLVYVFDPPRMNENVRMNTSVDKDEIQKPNKQMNKPTFKKKRKEKRYQDGG